MFSRSFFAVALCASLVLAAPSLSTIQDVLFKADGTPFSGVVTITWTSFQSADSSSVVKQSTTVTVVNGNFRVQLVPTTTGSPAVFYSVSYNSDGKVQFRETWAVPPSSRPLRVRDVRVSASNDTASGGTGGPINESDVIGLLADLESRPVKGPAYAAGRVAVVNEGGLLESVSGSPTDCVRVDGSSGPCGSSALSFVDADTPAGLVDGSNAQFTLSAAPNPASSLTVYRNGLLQKIGQDYTLAGSTIQFVAAAVPQAGDTLLASYRVSGDGSASPQSYPAPQVLCSGPGGNTSETAISGIGACAIPAGLLMPGDRIEVRYDLDHQGTAGGFSFELLWGQTVVGHRDVAAGERLMAARADAAITDNGSQVSYQSWGGTLPLSVGIAVPPDAYGNGLNLSFQGSVQNTADTLHLRGFAVVRVR